MGYYKNRQIRIMNGEGADFADLKELAERLGGEVDGRFVVCPAPGKKADDRSLTIIVDHRSPERFYIYDIGTSISYRRAHLYVCDKLGIEHSRGLARRNTPLALKIWNASLPAEGTIVERYLRSRAIDIPISDRIRFAPSLRHPTRGAFPAMIALVTDADDNPVGVHRTWLAWDGRGKAPVPKGEQRMALGPVDGNAVRLSPAADELLVGEGIETCLAGTVLSGGTPAWSAISAWNLRKVVLPTEVKSVVILADGETVGEKAAAFAWGRWRREGRRARVAHPPPGSDFNDVLIGSRPSC